MLFQRLLTIYIIIYQLYTNVLGHKACNYCKREQKREKKKLRDNYFKSRTLLGCNFFDRLPVTILLLSVIIKALILSI